VPAANGPPSALAERDLAFIATALLTGLRLSELLSLDLAQSTAGRASAA